MGYKTLDALATVLGEKKYFHGTELTGIDATAFGF
ncbi:glutathione S-transferase C-terminal domain-containing protein [Legionella tunisiensis]